MSSVAHDASLFVPPAEVEEVELYHPKNFRREVHLEPGRQNHRHPVRDHRDRHRVGGAGAVVVDAAAAGVPEQLLLYRPQQLPSVCHHARHDHGDLPAHRVVPGGFGNYLIPLMVGARDMVFPYVNMVSYWVYLFAVLLLTASFFVTGGPTGAGWTLYPPQAISQGTPGRAWELF